uniref:Uncharacterized protein n=1 Tax=Anthurium amnicola TaxID=1678845 RepID=A0A1D1XEQ5_9ARAE
MGRSVPTPDPTGAFTRHLPLDLALLAAWVAAVVAVSALLCGSGRHRRSTSSPKPRPSSKSRPPLPSFPSPPPGTDPSVGGASLRSPAAGFSHENGPAPEPKPEPAAAAANGLHGPLAGAGAPAPVAKSGSTRRGLSMSLSMKIPEGLARIRTGRKEQQPKAAEESIWMKAIILGEKCRVPDDEEGEQFGPCDDKGNRQRSYRPRTPRSLPASRANSFSDRRDAGAVDAVP